VGASAWPCEKRQPNVFFGKQDNLAEEREKEKMTEQVDNEPGEEKTDERRRPLKRMAEKQQIPLLSPMKKKKGYEKFKLVSLVRVRVVAAQN